MSAALQSMYADTTPVGGFSATLASVPASSTSNPPVESVTVTAKKTHDGLTFHDLLDVINPLQHIPVIGTIYRSLTGDTISPAARIAGDALYGGLIGLASSIVDTVVETETGKDIGEHIMATVFGDDDDTASAVKTAGSASPAATPAAGAFPAAGTTDLYHTLQLGGHDHQPVPLSTTVMGMNMHSNQHALSSQGPLTSSWSSAAANSAIAPVTPAAAPATPMPAAANTNLSPAQAAPNPLAAMPMANNTLMPSMAPASSMATGGNVPDLMMKALDQYKTMLQQRPAGAVAASGGAVNTMN